MYPTDFEAKTSHLSLEEDGAYNRLLRLMWMTPGCSLPDDAGWIMRRMRCDQSTFDRVVVPIITEFLLRKAGRIYSRKLTEIWEKADETYLRRSAAGKKGGRPQGTVNIDKTQKAGFDFDKAGPKQLEPEPDIEKREAKASPKKRGSRLPDDWFLPKSWGQWAVDEGYAQDVIRIEADNFRDYWRARAGPTASKLDWEATWRIWMRKTPKGKNNGTPAAKGQARLSAFMAGASAPPRMDSGQDSYPSQPLLARG